MNEVSILCGVFLILSKRIHSIFVLRLFNDCISVLFGYIALALFCNYQWILGSIFYSLAVSVKMNILLQSPGLLMLYLMGLGFKNTVMCLSTCAAIQIVLGWPFLSTYPVSYIEKSFELNRVFMYKWTVNLKFLSEEMFISKQLSLGLLVATVLGKMVVFIVILAYYNTSVLI